MLRLATLFVAACTALAMAAPTPDDDLDRVLRSVDSWDLLKAGVDYEYTDIGIVLRGKQRRSSCSGVASNLSCGTVTIPSTRDCDLKECTP